MSRLTDPIKVGKYQLNNRLVMAPVATELSDHGAACAPLFKYYFDRTSDRNVGLVVVEHNYVSPAGQASPGQMSVCDDKVAENLRYLADVIHYNGAKAILQINHAGAMASPETVGLPRVSVCDADRYWNFWKMSWEPAKIHGLTIEEIKAVEQDFVNAALRAKKAGFDGCEIHSAHGFLLNQFYSPLTNRRTDEYCGNKLTGRIRLHLELIFAIREACGEDFLLSMRFGARDYVDGGSTLKEAVVSAQAFEQAGLDLLDISGGMCGFTRKGHNEPGYFGDTAQAIKNSVAIPVVLTGGIRSRADADKLLAAGKADMIGIGRPAIKNEHFARDIIGGL